MVNVQDDYVIHISVLRVKQLKQLTYKVSCCNHQHILLYLCFLSYCFRNLEQSDTSNYNFIHNLKMHSLHQDIPSVTMLPVFISNSPAIGDTLYIHRVKIKKVPLIFLL